MFGKSGNYLGYVDLVNYGCTLTMTSLRGVKLQIAVGIIAGMDFLLFGYDQGVTGNLLTLASFNKVFPTINPQEPGLSSVEASNRSTYQGIVVASYNLGCFCGEQTSATLSNTQLME